MAVFEQIADLRFAKLTRDLYESAINATKELVEQYSNAGIASTGKFLRKTADLVLTQFKTVETTFEEVYLSEFSAAPETLTKQAGTWLRNKVQLIVNQQKDRAEKVTTPLCMNFGAPAAYRPYIVRLQDESRYMQEHLNQAIDLLALTAERHKKVETKRDLSGEIMEDKPKATPEPQGVWVIHGRDERLRRGLFDFLRNIGLHPLEFSEARRLTGKPMPYVGEILEAAFAHAQAVVVLLTPDDEARLRPDLQSPSDLSYEKNLTGQARPNVLFEAGMAFISHPDRTILVQIGEVRPFSDVAGRHIVHLDNSTQKRQDLANRLLDAGCSVKLSGTDWHNAGDLNPDAKKKQGRHKTKESPMISITQVPPWHKGGGDTAGTIAGTITGGTRGCKVVLFAHGDVWYVQPWTNHRYTNIEHDNTFRSMTHLGTEYAALLVNPDRYEPPETTTTLPPVGNGVLAITFVPAEKSSKDS
jgi:predicted nucleotide-binding protein